MTVFLLQGGAHQSIAQPLIGMAQDGEQAQVDWAHFCHLVIGRTPAAGPTQGDLEKLKQPQSTGARRPATSFPGAVAQLHIAAVRSEHLATFPDAGPREEGPPAAAMAQTNLFSCPYLP